jgi:hypothetical protein
MMIVIRGLKIRDGGLTSQKTYCGSDGKDKGKKWGDAF